ncbi:hypothetical protein CRG98_043731, partial [Punica granatum]
DFASPDFASGYCFPDSATILLLSGLCVSGLCVRLLLSRLRVPGLRVRLLLSGLRVHLTAFRTLRLRTLRPVIAFWTPRPLYCFQDFASPDIASGYCFLDSASTLLHFGLRILGLCVRLLLSRLHVHFTTFTTPRPFYCFQDFASPDIASGYCFLDSASTLLHFGLRILGLCVRLLLSRLHVHFTTFTTPRPFYCFQDFASPDIASGYCFLDSASTLLHFGLRILGLCVRLLLSRLHVHFTTFTTPRPFYCFQDFASPDIASGYCFLDSASTLLHFGLRILGLCVRLLLSRLHVHFTTFTTPRPFYCFQDFASPDIASGYCFLDSASTLLHFGLRILGLCVRLLLSRLHVHFTTFTTPRPFYCFQDFASPDIASGYCFLDSASTLLHFGLRILGLCVRLLLSRLHVHFTTFTTPRPFYCFQDFASPDIASGYCFLDSASTLLHFGLRILGLCVRLLLSRLHVHFTTFTTPRPFYCFQDFASPDIASGYCFLDSASTLLHFGLRILGLCVRLLLSRLHVHFTTFTTPRPFYCFQDFASPDIASGYCFLDSASTLLHFGLRILGLCVRLLLSRLHVHFTTFTTPRPFYCFQDFASPDIASGYCFLDSASTLLHFGLRILGLCVRLLLSRLHVHFTTFTTPRPFYCFQDFASPDIASGYCFLDSASTLLHFGLRILGLCVRLLLSRLHVHFTTFTTPRPFYCFQDFASPDIASGYCFLDSASTLLHFGLRILGLCVRLLLSRLHVHFTTFTTPRPFYCFQDFASPDIASGYCFLDSASTLLHFGLRILGLCVRLLLSRLHVHFTTFTTPRPFYCFQDFASPDFASGYCFLDSASTLLLSVFRVPELRVRLLLSEIRVDFTAFKTSRPRTLHPVMAFRTQRLFYCFQ